MVMGFLGAGSGYCAVWGWSFEVGGWGWVVEGEAVA